MQIRVARDLRTRVLCDRLFSVTDCIDAYAYIIHLEWKLLLSVSYLNCGNRY